MREIASTDGRKFGFADGAAYLPAIDISAALLAMSGAAWNGKSDSLPVPFGNGAWSVVTEQPGGRVIRIELVGHHKDYTPVEVRQAGGWTAHDGKHYNAGEEAPMLRVFYHLAGRYEYLTRGVATKNVKWDYDDFLFWFNAYHRRSLPIDCKTQVDQRNRLLDVNRNSYGIGSTTPQPGSGKRLEDVWPTK